LPSNRPDGVYALTASDGEARLVRAAPVVIQNGDQVGIADPDYADYHYGFGTLDACCAQALFFADGSQVGTFSLRFVGARAEGSQALSYGEGYTSTLSGTKVF
jgi:hypothetical protein